jgi:hypothetical protein
VSVESEEVAEVEHCRGIVGAGEVGFGDVLTALYAAAERTAPAMRQRNAAGALMAGAYTRSHFSST